MMAMSVTMHPIWESGGVILAAGIAGTLVLQILVHHFLSASVRLQHTSLGGAIVSVICTTHAVLVAFIATALVASGLLVRLLIVGLSSPFHGAVTIAPDAYVGVLEEMPVAH